MHNSVKVCISIVYSLINQEKFIFLPEKSIEWLGLLWDSKNWIIIQLLYRGKAVKCSSFKQEKHIISKIKSRGGGGGAQLWSNEVFYWKGRFDHFNFTWVSLTVTNKISKVMVLCSNFFLDKDVTHHFKLNPLHWKCCLKCFLSCLFEVSTEVKNCGII